MKFLQDYSKDAVTHVQKYLMKNEVPVSLFEVIQCKNSKKKNVVTKNFNLYFSHI